MFTLVEPTMKIGTWHVARVLFSSEFETRVVLLTVAFDGHGDESSGRMVSDSMQFGVAATVI